jgi:hypothetical protein
MRDSDNREECPYCFSKNYINNNSENLGFEAYECWNCHQHTFLPDQGIYRFMDRMGCDEFEANQSLQSYDPIITDGRSTPNG